MEKHGREMQKGKQKTPSCSGTLKPEAAMPPTCSQVVTSRDRSDDGKGRACQRERGLVQNIGAKSTATQGARPELWVSWRIQTTDGGNITTERALGTGKASASSRLWASGPLPGGRETHLGPGTGRQRGAGPVKGRETRADVLGARERGQKINLKEFFWLEGGI